MTNITHEWLINNGFKEYSRSPIDSEAIDHVYQKSYRDERGKKYFLEVKHWKLVHPITNEDLSGYEVSGQFYLKGNHNAVNISFINSDVDEAEEFIEKLFDNNMLEYYEIWQA